MRSRRNVWQCNTLKLNCRRRSRNVKNKRRNGHCWNRKKRQWRSEEEKVKKSRRFN